MKGKVKSTDGWISVGPPVGRHRDSAKSNQKGVLAAVVALPPPGSFLYEKMLERGDAFRLWWPADLPEPVPRRSIRSYGHDLGSGSLCLRASDGSEGRRSGNTMLPGYRESSPPRKQLGGFHNPTLAAAFSKNNEPSRMYLRSVAR